MLDFIFRRIHRCEFSSYLPFLRMKFLFLYTHSTTWLEVRLLGHSLLKFENKSCLWELGVPREKNEPAWLISFEKQASNFLPQFFLANTVKKNYLFILGKTNHILQFHIYFLLHLLEHHFEDNVILMLDIFICQL